jgi:putative lipoic acid-binding regulatory protein
MKPNFPSLDLIKANHLFPGPYIFKVIGKNEPAFVARVVAAVREELGYLEDPLFTSREAEGGRHIAVTLELFFEKPETVLLVYERLFKLQGLVLLL